MFKINLKGVSEFIVIDTSSAARFIKSIKDDIDSVGIVSEHSVLSKGKKVVKNIPKNFKAYSAKDIIVLKKGNFSVSIPVRGEAGRRVDNTSDYKRVIEIDKRTKELEGINTSKGTLGELRYLIQKKKDIILRIIEDGKYRVSSSWKAKRPLEYTIKITPMTEAGQGRTVVTRMSKRMFDGALARNNVKLKS